VDVEHAKLAAPGRENPIHDEENAMLMRSKVLAVSVGALLFGCAVDQDENPQDENQEIINNLVEAGFPADDIMVVDGLVYVGRDAQVTLEASREMLETVEVTDEQYRTTNLVGSNIGTICINPSSAFTGDFSTGIDLAIENYNQLGLSYTLVRNGSNCDASIRGVLKAGLVGGSSGFPKGGKPYRTINIGDGLAPFGVDVIEHVITHEIGHTVGLRHSDFFDRSISCGSGGNEGDAGIGAIHIPGTPTGATVGGSVMNSCFRSSESGEWTSSDRTALTTLY
jgi:hypothetical protein